MNLLSFLFPFAYMGQGQILGQQQQTEWDAANQRNSLLNQGLGIQTAQQADEFQKLQAENAMLAQQSLLASAQGQQAANNGAPPAVTQPDISAAAGMTYLAQPPAPAQAAPQQPQPTQTPAQTPQQTIAAQAAGTQPAPQPAQAPATPAQAAATSQGVQPADPKVRAAAIAQGQTPPAAAGSSPAIAHIASMPLEKLNDIVDQGIDYYQKRLQAAIAVGDGPRADMYAKELFTGATQLRNEISAQARLQVDQLKGFQFAASQVASNLGNPAIKTAADFQQAKMGLMASPAWDFLNPDQQQRILAANPTDANVGQATALFRNAGMTAAQQANDQAKERTADALAAQRNLQNKLAVFRADLAAQDEQRKQQQATINAKAGKVGNVASKADNAVLDNLLAPTYFGKDGTPNPDDPDYQQLRESIYEGARGRQAANRALGFQQAVQMEMQAAQQRGDFTPASTKQVPGRFYGTNTEEIPGKLSLQGITPDKPITVTKGFDPKTAAIGRYYLVPEGPRKGLYQWDGTKPVKVE